MRHATLMVMLLICWHGPSRTCWAIELWADSEGRRGDLDIAGKATALASDTPTDPLLFPPGHSHTALVRLRLGLGIQHSDRMNSELAYEQRARWMSGAAGLGAGSSFLPSDAEAPFRVTQLDREICGDDDYSYRHEIDRGLIALHPDWGEVTVGRQAIGLGRGVLFGAVDVFSPFSPLEVDREWRRGVDAVRAEYRFSTTHSAELLSVFGESWEQSALLGRFRGYVGEIDGSLLVGKRAEDFMVGTAVSAVVKDAEVHGEVAVFDTPERWPNDDLWGDDHLVMKTVLGVSYTFDVGNGLTVLGEHHYSGFGVEDAEDILARLQDTDFQARFLRGDSQILGRQALAAQISYPFDDVVQGSLLVLTNPTDGSGVVSPSLRLDVDRNITFVSSVFVPWGDEPSGGELKSEYGVTGASLFLQANVYF